MFLGLIDSILSGRDQRETRAGPATSCAVRVSGGRYLVGSRSGRADEQPEHCMTFGAFEMDVFPLTVLQVYHILEKAGKPLPAAWRSRPPLSDGVPATQLTLAEAEIIGRLLGRRLPTEEEFEVAGGRAFGRDGPAHPQTVGWPLPLMAEMDAKARGLVTGEGLVGVVGIIWQWT